MKSERETSSIVSTGEIPGVVSVMESRVIIDTGERSSVEPAKGVPVVEFPAEITGVDSVTQSDINKFLLGEMSAPVGGPAGFHPLVDHVTGGVGGFQDEHRDVVEADDENLSLVFDIEDRAEHEVGVAHSECLSPSEDTTESGFTSQYVDGSCSRAEKDAGSPCPVVSGYCTIFNSHVNP